MTEFEGVIPALGRALSNRGYEVLTPVQEAVLAPELAGSDLLVSAQTGSGKTVAFGLAFAPDLLNGAERFERAGAPMALVVAPTRELALQVKGELDWLFEPTGARLASCVGGMDYRSERRTLERGVHIVVGTPGRLRDHIERGSLNTSELKVVVLDEADEMLDLGFRDDLEYILGTSPPERRTMMFSATVPRSIATLAKRYQKDAVRVSTVDEQKQHLDIEYRALSVAPNDRENAIVNLLRFYEAKNAIVFCSTRATVNHMTSRFSNRGFSVVALSGELSQNERSHALQALRDGRARVCIATDVAARGLDLPNLELVIHADIPKNPEGLLHRSGRTGRAGRKGVSALIVPYNWRKRTERLLQSAKISAVWAKPPSVEDVIQRDNERILADPAFENPIGEDEKDFAERLLASHGADKVAAAFIRAYRAGRSAPEELMDNAPIERSKDRREDRREDRSGGRDKERASERRPRSTGDFDGGIWFSLSIGRKHSAEPRWLIPMLCRAGKITKRDIGAILIHQNKTDVELKPGSVEKFLEILGPELRIEKTVSVTRLPGKPDADGEGEARPYSGKKYNKSRSAPEKPKSSEANTSTKPGHGKTDEVEANRPKDSTAKRKKPRHSKKPKKNKIAGSAGVPPSSSGKHKKRNKPKKRPAKPAVQ